MSSTAEGANLSRSGGGLKFGISKPIAEPCARMTSKNLKERSQYESSIFSGLGPFDFRYRMWRGYERDAPPRDGGSLAAPSQTGVNLAASTSYCASGASNNASEWIESVAFNGQTVRSGRTTGYSYTDLSSSVTLSVGMQSVGLTPTFLRRELKAWRAWIDFNGDKTFSSSELVASGSTSTSGRLMTGSFEIPSTVVGGKTRIRFSMQRSDYPPSCGTFTYGEVEDYDVTVKPESWSQTVNFENVFGQAVGVTLKPDEEYKSVRTFEGLTFDGTMFDNYDQSFSTSFPFTSDWICFSTMTVTFPRPVLKVAFQAGHRWTSGATTVAVNDWTNSLTLVSYLPRFYTLQAIEAKAKTLPFKTLTFSSRHPTRPCIDTLQIKYAP